jgi:hypothetical protein
MSNEAPIEFRMRQPSLWPAVLVLLAAAPCFLCGVACVGLAFYAVGLMPGGSSVEGYPLGGPLAAMRFAALSALCIALSLGTLLITWRSYLKQKRWRAVIDYERMVVTDERGRQTAICWNDVGEVCAETWHFADRPSKAGRVVYVAGGHSREIDHRVRERQALVHGIIARAGLERVAHEETHYGRVTRSVERWEKRESDIPG